MKKAVLGIGFAILIIVLGVATLAAAPGTMNASITSPEIEGTWLATIPSPGGDEFPSLVTFARGGALIVTDGGTRPAVGNVYQGTWVMTGPHEYTFTFLGFVYEDESVLTGYFRVHEIVQVDPGGNSYISDSTGEFLDLDMNVIFSFESTNSATRIDAN